MTCTSDDTELLADAVRTGVTAVLGALSEPSADRGREDWLALAAACQALGSTVAAVQDVAVAEVARREGVWCEDGTLGEVVHAPGRVTVDAADLLAPALGATHGHAQRRVEQAVRLAEDRVPVEADSKDIPERSGLRGLHLAMADGRLDAYRAGVVAHELEMVPAEVSGAVVSALDGQLTDDAPTLRRRTRRMLARISPDLLRQRAERARASTGLRRWVAEPGVDAWFGTFPIEDAAPAWAALDRLAHDLVAGGTCTSVEQARGKALTEIVNGNATIDVQVVLTVPADAADAADAVDVVVPTVPADAADVVVLSVPADAAGNPDVVVLTVPADATPVAGAPDADDAIPAPSERRVGTMARGSGSDDLVEVQGARAGEPLLVRRGWLAERVAQSGAGRVTTAACDRRTGARVDPDDDLATDAYRPGPGLAALVRARDGRCRFPGCAVAGRFCDLDHVRPWPVGRTSAANLLCLCRRHHRVKQAAGWSVRLAEDATATWTDPSGRVRSTRALDALELLVLAADDWVDLRGPAPPAPPAGELLPPWSALETHVELYVEHRPIHRRCTSAAQLRQVVPVRRVRASAHEPPPF
jgi:hypothetical protein